MWVKICANTNLADALLAAELGADAVGFVFAPSKRQVTVDQIAAITPHLPAGVEKVGVFTSTNADEILQAASAAGLTCVQLHSDFNPRLVDAIDAGSGGRLQVLQVVDVSQGMDPAVLQRALAGVLRHPFVMAALLDASHGGESGGTGKTFEWTRVAATVRQAQDQTDGRVILAGGLRTENVGEAIDTFSPWGIDVASGVEAAPGTKDPARLRSFLLEARRPRSPSS